MEADEGAQKEQPKGEDLYQEWFRKGGLLSCFSQEDTERERNSTALLAECDREEEGMEVDRENEKDGRSDALSYMILSDWTNHGTRSKEGFGRRNRNKKRWRACGNDGRFNVDLELWQVST